MSVADLHDLELIWPSLGPTDVIVTGTFDQWSSSIHLVKGGAGFVATVKVPWGKKVAYKFIVDGDWRCRDDRPQEDDGQGNINNVLETPEKPEIAVAPARLSIPLDGGYGDVENMVTAVEFLPSAEPAAVRGSLPLPIPQITVEGLGPVPSPVNESKLNTAAATEGNISPASGTPAETTPDSSRPLDDHGSVPPRPINGNEDAIDGILTHAPNQLTKEESDAAVNTTPQTSHSPQTAEVDVSSVAVPEPTAKQSKAPETAPQAPHREAAVPVSNDQAPTPSTPTSSTLTHKKRRSFFARIKHIFEKDKGKQEGKEKNKR